MSRKQVQSVVLIPSITEETQEEIHRSPVLCQSSASLHPRPAHRISGWVSCIASATARISRRCFARGDLHRRPLLELPPRPETRNLVS